jgi:hypothetical protein
MKEIQGKAIMNISIYVCVCVCVCIYIYIRNVGAIFQLIFIWRKQSLRTVKYEKRKEGFRKLEYTFLALSHVY